MDTTVAGIVSPCCPSDSYLAHLAPFEGTIGHYQRTDDNVNEDVVSTEDCHRRQSIRRCRALVDLRSQRESDG